MDLCLNDQPVPYFYVTNVPGFVTNVPGFAGCRLACAASHLVGPGSRASDPLPCPTQPGTTRQHRQHRAFRQQAKAGSKPQKEVSWSFATNFHHLVPPCTDTFFFFQADNSVSTVAFKFQAHHHFSRPINPQAVQGVEAARRPREPEYGGGHAGPNTAGATRARIRRGPREPEYGGGHAGPNTAGATRARMRRGPRETEYGGGHAGPNTAGATRARIRRRPREPEYGGGDSAHARSRPPEPDRPARP